MIKFTYDELAIIKHALEVLREDVLEGPAYMVNDAQAVVDDERPVLSVIDAALKKIGE